MEIFRTSQVKFDEETVRNLFKKRIEAELEMSDQAGLKAGALELLESLKGKFKLALASMNNKPVINRMLKTCNVREFFRFGTFSR